MKSKSLRSICWRGTWITCSLNSVKPNRPFMRRRPYNPLKVRGSRFSASGSICCAPRVNSSWGLRGTHITCMGTWWVVRSVRLMITSWTSRIAWCWCVPWYKNVMKHSISSSRNYLRNPHRWFFVLSCVFFRRCTNPSQRRKWMWVRLRSVMRLLFYR